MNQMLVNKNKYLKTRRASYLVISQGNSVSVLEKAAQLRNWNLKVKVLAKVRNKDETFLRILIQSLYHQKLKIKKNKNKMKTSVRNMSLRSLLKFYKNLPFKKKIALLNLISVTQVLYKSLKENFRLNTRVQKHKNFSETKTQI